MRHVVARGDLQAWDLDAPLGEDGVTSVHVELVDGDVKGGDRHVLAIYHDDPRWEVEIPVADLLDLISVPLEDEAGVRLVPANTVVMTELEELNRRRGLS